MNKFSLIITTKNEEKNIEKLLDSLLEQTKLPDEIIFVDGGSTDKTVAIIKRFQSRYSFILLFKQKGNISVGRNYAIKKSRHQIIVQTDAGCIAHKKWFERITEPFNKTDIDVVAGFYEMTYKSSFQKALAPFLGVVSQKFDENYLPSGRSIAFRKGVWKKLKGYPESLNKTGEDTLFVYEIVNHNYKIVRVKNALVYWELPKTLPGAFNKFRWYAYGDAQTKIWWHPTKRFHTHTIKILSIYMLPSLEQNLSSQLYLRLPVQQESKDKLGSFSV